MTEVHIAAHILFASFFAFLQWRVGPDTVCGWPCVMENVSFLLPSIEVAFAPLGTNKAHFLLTEHIVILYLRGKSYSSF